MEFLALPPHGKTAQELVLEGLSLRNGAQGAVEHALSIELDRALGEVEPLLDDRCELPDPAALVAENFLRARGANDDLCAGRGAADLHTRVALLSQLTTQKFVQFRVEDAI